MAATNHHDNRNRISIGRGSHHPTDRRVASSTGRTQGGWPVTTAREALAEARRAYADALQARREIEAAISNRQLATELAAALTWLQQNPHALRNLLRRQPPISAMVPGRR